MRIQDGLKLDYKDVLIVPQRSDISSRSKVELTREYKFKHTPKWLTVEGLGVIAANMDTTGTFAMSKALTKHNMFTALHKHYTAEDLAEYQMSHWGQDNGFITIGTSQDDLDKLEKVLVLIERGTCENTDFPYMINLDVANGFNVGFVKHLNKVRERFPNSVIMAGNVVGGSMTKELILGGADIVKIGIGPGSVCETRVKAGVGYPQLSAIDEAAYEAHGIGGLVCADGGCTRVGDICKAFAAGADFVMLGGMFAGTRECDGEWEWERHENGIGEKRKSLKFYGMSSQEANEKYNGGLKDYKAAEGKCVKVPYKGKVEKVVREIKGGLASCCSYVGATNIKDLPKCASFVRVAQQENTIF
jgi:GMP reductase